MLALPARAAPIAYTLERTETRVGFGFSISGVAQAGTMPVARADMTIDPDNLANSRVDVLLQAAEARTGLFLATQALKSAQVLNTAQFPTIRFTSSAIELADGGRLSGGAQVEGRLTIRDVSRPIRLTASLFRPPGTAVDDLQRLTVQMSGGISRSAWGVIGYRELVDDIVTFDIRAALRAIN